MIWIATLLLLGIAAWFLLEGNNERRWVMEHLDDESVAADKGLFARYDELKDAPEPEQRYSVAQDSKKVGQLAAAAREKTAKLGAKLDKRASVESVDASSVNKQKQRIDRRNKLTGSDSFIGRNAEKLSQKAEKIGDRIPEGRLVSDSKYGDQEPSGARRFINSITDRLDRIDAKVNQS